MRTLHSHAPAVAPLDSPVRAASTMHGESTTACGVRRVRAPAGSTRHRHRSLSLSSAPVTAGGHLLIQRALHVPCCPTNLLSVAVDVPRGHGHTVGCKWVFKIKELASGTVERFKSRLTAKGFTQTKHLNYELIFSPVVRFATVLHLLAGGLPLGSCSRSRISATSSSVRP